MSKRRAPSASLCAPTGGTARWNVRRNVPGNVACAASGRRCWPRRRPPPSRPEPSASSPCGPERTALRPRTGSRPSSPAMCCWSPRPTPRRRPPDGTGTPRPSWARSSRSARAPRTTTRWTRGRGTRRGPASTAAGSRPISKWPTSPSPRRTGRSGRRRGRPAGSASRTPRAEAARSSWTCRVAAAGHDHAARPVHRA
jgi:hypothetical protein